MTDVKTKQSIIKDKWKDYMGLSLFLSGNALIVGVSVSNVMLIVIGSIAGVMFFIFGLLATKITINKDCFIGHHSSLYEKLSEAESRRKQN